jgi:polysaccharide biosynthesis/export protein
MQPARLGALTSCVASALFGTLALAPSSRAQTIVGTPQQTNERIRELSSVVRTPPHDYVIGPGDLVQVEVFDVPELSRELRVSQSGAIGIPLVPTRLHVAGLTETQAEDKITEVLEANGLVSHPRVSVYAKERKSKPITIVGAVAHPMVFQMDGPATLLEVLAQAGGIASDAGDTVLVTRPAYASGTTFQPESSTESAQPPEIGPEAPLSAFDSTGTSQAAVPPAATAPHAPNAITVNLNELVENGDATNNIPLQPGDIVTVPHAGIVYVLGAVSRPGGFVLANDRGQMSALKILALAGGLNRTAKSDRAVIIRKDNQGKQHEVPLDLKKVTALQSEDVLLQPSDILFVPNSGTKQAILRTAELAIALGSAVALYRVAYH